MPLQLGTSIDDEFASCVPMTFEAMGGRSDFVNIIWPRGLTEEGQQKSMADFLCAMECVRKSETGGDSRRWTTRNLEQ